MGLKSWHCFAVDFSSSEIVSHDNLWRILQSLDSNSEKRQSCVDNPWYLQVFASSKLRGISLLVGRITTTFEQSYIIDPVQLCQLDVLPPSNSLRRKVLDASFSK